MPQVPPQLLNNPTHVIQHLAFGSIVLLSNGISHGICPHKQRVPVVRAGKRMESQVQSHPVHFSTGASQQSWVKTALNSTRVKSLRERRMEQSQRRDRMMETQPEREQKGSAGGSFALLPRRSLPRALQLQLEVHILAHRNTGFCQLVSQKHKAYARCIPFPSS